MVEVVTCKRACTYCTYVAGGRQASITTARGRTAHIQHQNPTEIRSAARQRDEIQGRLLHRGEQFDVLRDAAYGESRDIAWSEVFLVGAADGTTPATTTGRDNDTKHTTTRRGRGEGAEEERTAKAETSRQQENDAEGWNGLLTAGRRWERVGQRHSR